MRWDTLADPARMNGHKVGEAAGLSTRRLVRLVVYVIEFVVSGRGFKFGSAAGRGVSGSQRRPCFNDLEDLAGEGLRI